MTTDRGGGRAGRDDGTKVIRTNEGEGKEEGKAMKMNERLNSLHPARTEQAYLVLQLHK